MVSSRAAKQQMVYAIISSSDLLTGYFQDGIELLRLRRLQDPGYVGPSSALVIVDGLRDYTAWDFRRKLAWVRTQMVSIGIDSENILWR